MSKPIKVGSFLGPLPHPFCAHQYPHLARPRTSVPTPKEGGSNLSINMGFFVGAPGLEVPKFGGISYIMWNLKKTMGWMSCILEYGPLLECQWPPGF